MGQEESNHIKSQLKPEQKFPILSKSLFDFLYIIGRGGFGKVWKVSYKKTQTKYALKEMSKVKIIDRKSEKSIKNEKDFLSQLHHPFIVNMICSFQDYDNLYLVMDLLSGGDLRYHICHKKKFSESQTKFIIACVITGLQYIHSNNIIHRDIKPENLVLDSNGYVAITDFGVAKRNSKDNSNETSGTPGYMAPEVLCAQNHSFPVDFFAVGVMGFEFMNGYRPYLGRNRKEIKEAVLSRQAHIHRKDALNLGWSIESCDFINRMVYRKPMKRLGFKGIGEIKAHDWFKGFEWDLLEMKKMKSFFVPRIGDNFDKKYCEGIEKIDSQTKERYQYYMSKEKFKDLFFNYTFIKNDMIPTNEKKVEKRKVLNNNSSNRNTTTSSRSSTNNINININNFNNLKVLSKHNHSKSPTGCSNPNFNLTSTAFIKYLENNNKNNTNNRNNTHNRNNSNNKSNINNKSNTNNKGEINNSNSNIKNSPSSSIIQIPQNKYTSLNIDRNSEGSRKLIYSPIHNPNNSSLNFDIKKEIHNKTIQHNNSSSNISNKIISPISSYSRPVSRINININNENSNISNLRINYSNLTHRKSLYQYPNSGNNLSHTNFNNNTNNTLLKNNYYYNSNNNNNDSNIDIKSSRYSKISKEKHISNPNAPTLSKTASMKFLNFNASYLNNLNSQRSEIQKIKYTNYKNNRLGSTSHYNFEKSSNPNKYILSQRKRHISGNSSTYRKNSNHSGLTLIHHHQY